MVLGTVIVLRIAACAGGEEAAKPTPAGDASVLFQQLIDGINSGDTAASMALFAEDATSEGGPHCATAPCVGKAAIQTDIEFYVSDRVGISQCATEAAVSAVTAKCELRTNGTRRSGIDRFIGSLSVEAHNGQLSAFRWGAIDISDELTATYFGVAGPTLYQQYIDAMNRGDIASVMALFADDAVFEGGAECSATPCSGKEAIQRLIEHQVAEKFSLTSTRPELFDPFATFSRVTDVLEIDATPGAAAPQFAPIELKVRDGKIVSVQFGTRASE